MSLAVARIALSRALKKSHLSTFTLSTAPKHATCIHVPQLCYLVEFLNLNALQLGHIGLESSSFLSSLAMLSERVAVVVPMGSTLELVVAVGFLNFSGIYLGFNGVASFKV